MTNIMQSKNVVSFEDAETQYRIGKRCDPENGGTKQDYKTAGNSVEQNENTVAVTFTDEETEMLEDAAAFLKCENVAAFIKDTVLMRAYKLGNAIAHKFNVEQNEIDFPSSEESETGSI